ncbi:cryptochrome/photolyase family protein [Sphingobacterium faecale]|uniref:Deoxyribodipyrimidine photo-lyase n=1 Tax=Sphingobacterium faecale TaxID=2803775 RepID=A0ABS1QYH9_9SPHI|nr:deoxyribodipyrimidine photo-lyase [Sphingobacterium faecale]MBL1407140.1 deoxyribodipyrimidine photo-lyase [Sphingobacterium faecale]
MDVNKARVSIFWFRRDLRLNDNHALSQALKSGEEVLPVFIFDTDILKKLPDSYDRRVDYIHRALIRLKQELLVFGTDLRIYVGKPLAVFEKLQSDYQVTTVFCNTDYEPDAIKRDELIKNWADGAGIGFRSFKDQVIFEKSDVLKKDGSPYTVFTPYSRVWKAKLTTESLLPFEMDAERFKKLPFEEIPTLEDIGFQQTDLTFVKPVLDEGAVREYDKFRDFPALDSTTRLGVALRFGTISIRECVSLALKCNETWLNELIWREFFMQILFHFPDSQTKCFKSAYEGIAWRNNEKEFEAWCNGETGYALVDAGMRELNETGFMHNRVRMVVASFLTKHLLIDWRWGEAYFAEKLLDYDCSANVGNWQWAAGCGCDAALYFRVFNPEEQLRKFDKELIYVKRWNPEFESKAMNRIVEHAFARDRALHTYKNGLGK